MKVIKAFRSLSVRSSKDHLINSAMLCLEPNFIKIAEKYMKVGFVLRDQLTIIWALL